MKNRLLLALSLLVASASVFAQYPSRPIRLIVGFPPGGSADPIARIVGNALAERLGQPVLVENKPGADSAIAADLTAKSLPDGYTIFYGSNSAMTAAVALRKTPPYDALADFSQISLLGRATVILYAHAGVPATSTAELVAHARANPGKLNYGTGNPLSILDAQQMMNIAGIQMVHVPYKGEGPAIPDLVAGRVQLSFLSATSAIALAKEGRLRPLFVLLDQRSPLLPDVPTAAEAGMGGITVRHWAGLFGPAKIPREIVARLNRETNAVLARPDVREQLQRQGFVVQGSTPEELAALNRADLALWKQMVREAGIVLE